MAEPWSRPAPPPPAQTAPPPPDLATAARRAARFDAALRPTARLSRRAFLCRSPGRPRLLKLAAPGPGADALRAEALAREALPPGVAPPLEAFLEDAEGAALLRAYAPGPTLAERKGALRAAALRAALEAAHGAGWAHGDLRPENVVLRPDGPRLIDWETAIPLGARLDALPRRAHSPGWSAPRLVWATGAAAPDLDFWPFHRLIERGYLV